MNFENGKTYTLYAKFEAINSSDSMYNLQFRVDKDNVINVKTKDPVELEISKVYHITFNCFFNGTRNQLVLQDYRDIVKCDLDEDSIKTLEKFYPYVSVGIPTLEKELDYYINSINNKVIKDIVLELFKKYRHDFLIYPAAVKMHHHYIGGLAYHSLTIAKMADMIAGTYESVDRDYLIAGALLHDISKVVEFESPTDEKYSSKGLLLGHLVLGAMEVEKAALKLGYENKEEVMLLEHIIVSHHGQLQYGACKRPITPEAVILWLLDTMDSKLRVIDETFQKIDEGTFSDAIGVMERLKCYKKKNNHE